MMGFVLQVLLLVKRDNNDRGIMLNNYFNWTALKKENVYVFSKGNYLNWLRSCFGVYVRKVYLSSKEKENTCCLHVSLMPAHIMAPRSLNHKQLQDKRMVTLFQLACLEHYLYQHKITNKRHHKVIVSMSPSLLLYIEK